MRQIIFITIFSFFIRNESNISKSYAASDNCTGTYLIECGYEDFILGDTIFSKDVMYLPLNCKGDLKIIEFYSSGALLAEKYYTGIKLLDTLNIADPQTFDFIKKEISYFKKDVPKGVWLYYNNDGSIWKQINFDE